MSTTYNITLVPDTEIEDGARAVFQGSVSFPDHVDHLPDGEDLLDENDEPVLLTFEDVNVYMPTDQNARETAMQAYADDYQSGYWAAVADGHRSVE